MTTTAVIVQARLNATRLPGAILQTLGQQTALIRCLDRCRATPGVDLVVCAIPGDSAHDPVEEEAGDHGYMVVRGPGTDPLGLYAEAAEMAGATTLVHVPASAAFADPGLIAQTLALHRDSRADYATNAMPPRFPHGLECAVFSSRCLFEVEAASATVEARQSVSQALRADSRLVRASLTGPGGGLERLRWVLEREEDLVFLRAVFAALGADAARASAAEIAALCLRRPDLVEINSACVDEMRLGAGDRADIETDPVSLSLAA